MLDAVQSSTENGAYYSLTSLKKGEPVADIPFAILSHDLYSCFEPTYFHGKIITTLSNNGILIIDFHADYVP